MEATGGERGEHGRRAPREGALTDPAGRTAPARSASVPATTASAPAFAAALDPIGSWIAEGVIARAAAVVRHDGAIVAERYWGSATDGGALDAGTLFPFASLTKPSLATAILRLVERGALSLELTVGDALPEAPGETRQVTIAQLLTHTAGVPEHVPGGEALEARQAPVAEYVRATLAGGLLFQPGTRVLYSNAGFQVLGAVVERATGVAVADLLDRETFAPAGMASATLRPLTRPGARVARVELGAARAADPRTEIYNSPYFKRLARADAGLFATVRDVATLLELYRVGGGGVLSPAMARGAVTSHTHGIPGRYGPYEWESCDFGWGWEVKGGK
ncbi:MAG: beta-lactamase family protein, partial [Gemmatimonadaceae bacterium]|nr:beta-lactamase family protein [Gemmatimonadaceae bacterium]